MLAKAVAQVSVGFPYVTLITFAALDEVYQVSGDTCVSMVNVNVSITRVNNRGHISVSACLATGPFTWVCPTIACGNTP